MKLEERRILASTAVYNILMLHKKKTLERICEHYEIPKWGPKRLMVRRILDELRGFRPVAFITTNNTATMGLELLRQL